jgi:hypothetical protein
MILNPTVVNRMKLLASAMTKVLRPVSMVTEKGIL